MTAAAKSPGKIILTGEHSVVYGAPAIVAAVAKYTEVRFTALRESKSIQTFIQGFPHIADYPLRGLAKLKHKLDDRFSRFIGGELPVNRILNRPEDLIIYTLASLAGHLPLPGPRTHLPLPNPGRLHTQSELPLGAGMGSSAAAIAATLVLYEHLLNLPLSLEQRFERIRFCERLQHGKGSAIDAAAVTYGGIQHLENGEPAAVEAQLDGRWYCALQGIPAVSTGEAVAHVRARHGADAALWQAFASVSQTLHSVLLRHASPRDAIRENHRLLVRIGVVPRAAQDIIAAIEAAGGAAKISGAGANAGENAGMLLAYTEDGGSLPALLQWQPLEIAEQGACLIEPASLPYGA